MLCTAHIQVDALNRQALVSVVYIRELGIDGYCPKCILLLLTVLLPEIVSQIRSQQWCCRLMRVHLAWRLGGQVG